MEENNRLDIHVLEGSIKDIAQQVIHEQDVEKTKDLVSMFNWNMSKKNVARLLKLNSLFDAVSDQMIERFSKKPDQFSNSDLIDYMKAVQGAIDTSSKNLALTEEPPVIVQNNTQINVNMSEPFSRDSRARIAEAVQAILSKASQPETICVDFEDKTDTSLDENQAGE